MSRGQFQRLLRWAVAFFVGSFVGHLVVGALR